jgi:hypothetical protein
VKDFLHTGEGSNTLGILVELALDDRPLYPSVLETPYFFRRIQRWISEGIKERKMIKEFQDKNAAS